MRRNQLNSHANAQACRFSTPKVATITTHNGDPRCETHQPPAIAKIIRLRTQLRCSRANI